MGLAFDLSTVNWLAYVIRPDGPVPRRSSFEEQESLRLFLSKLPDRFFSSERREADVRRMANEIASQLDNLPYDQQLPISLLEKLRKMLSDYAWLGLIVPSMDHDKINQYLTSRELLGSLVYEEHWEDGLLLQPENWDADPKLLLDVFPAFQAALNEITRWPGMLFWTPRNDDSVFLPFPTKTRDAIRRCAGWAVVNLRPAEEKLSTLKEHYLSAFPDARPTATAVTTLLHISDTHIGSREANTSIPRLQQLLRNAVSELPRGQGTIPIFTGDLIDAPEEPYYDNARQFMDFLYNLTDYPPVTVLGNHDTRDGGYLSEKLRMAIRMPADKVRWFDDRRLALVCFNSVLGGNLANGNIGLTQFADTGSEIDRKPNWREYTLVGVLHHHPITVEPPEWYLAPLYQRILGGFFDRSDELQDAKMFRDFAMGRRFAAVMHGHKHIPRVSKFGEADQVVAVFGCGSSVGKVPTNDDKLFLSINRVDINHDTNKMSCRLMVERTLGAGMEDWEKHEIFYGRHIK